MTCVEAPLPSFRHLRSEHYGHPPVEAIAFSKIPRVSFPTPADLDLDTVLSWVQGYWFRQATGWIGKYLHPQGAMPYYGREISDRTGQAILWTMLAGQHSEAQRRLVAGYCVQRGLDFVGFALDAGSKYARDFYGPNAGHCNGFVWPALFAGLLLENDALLEAASGKTGILWSERAQTFVVEETSPGVFNQDYGGYLPIEVGMPDWGEGHATQPQNDDWRWTTAEPLRPGQKTNVSAKSANYRLCCSHTTQHAQIAGIEAMKAKAAFAHDPYFAYHKRFLAENKRRGITDWRNAWTKWTLEALYRVAPEYLPT